VPIFTKDSLDRLKTSVDLVDLLDSYLDMKKTGAAYKALCPFHDEKSPSFVIQQGDDHYHCFGCGAHGDALQFLMEHQKLGFVDAVEHLADRFKVQMEYSDADAEEKGPSKKRLKFALGRASLFFHTLLLHSPEGHEALKYLLGRGIDLDFIKTFQIGYAPRFTGPLARVLQSEGVTNEEMLEAGILRKSQDGKTRDFFSERITFPICAPSGEVIGFSARKFKESTFGGKYINTTETPVFKKSRVLFGLHASRRDIAKTRKALLVEGQLDALRLLYAGVRIACASQGTAFGEGHAAELINLGVREVFLAFDSDNAGLEAAAKVGQIFQKKGIAVKVVQMPEGKDPDEFVKEEGADAFLELMESGDEYLDFLYHYNGTKIDLSTPAGKNEVLVTMTQQIRSWESQVLVHESLKRLAHVAKVPEEMVVTATQSRGIYYKNTDRAGKLDIDPDTILEMDLLRWLLLMGGRQPQLNSLVEENMCPDDLRSSPCRQILDIYLREKSAGRPCNWMQLAGELSPDGQALLTEIHKKRVNREKVLEHVEDTILKILTRNWMHEREQVRQKIQSGTCSDQEVLELVRKFDQLKGAPPEVKKVEHAETSHLL
jgi:DNA primase